MTAKLILTEQQTAYIIKSHIEDNVSVQNIANTLSIQRRQVERCLIENGLKVLNQKELNRLKYPMLTDVNWIEQKYKIEGNSIADLANIVGCSTQLIQNVFKELNIKPTRPHASRTIKVLGPNYLHITKDWIIEQYVTNRRSIKSIQSELGVSSSLIERVLRELNITVRSRKEQNTRLTKDQRINAKIASDLRTRLWISLKSQGASKSQSTTEELKKVDIRQYLETRFKSGMTWDNWGKRDGWEIDHIVPLSAFNLSNPEEQARAISYTNLQPLWRHENRKKSSSICAGKALVYLVAGLNGVGKSWVCRQLDKDKCSYIEYDAYPKDKHLNAILGATSLMRPIIYDNPFDARTFIKNNINKLDIKLVVVDESDDIVIDRLLLRGSSHATIAKVIRRRGKIERLKNKANFVGTSQEVLDYLKTQIEKAD